MSDYQKLKETLSALLDGEAGKVDQLELRRLVRSLEDHPDLLETYQRYTVMRAVLSGEPTPSLTSNLPVNVRAAIAQEEMDDVVPLSKNTPARDVDRSNIHWLKAAGRVAIAASVAAVAVYVIQIQSSLDDVTNNAVAVQPAVQNSGPGVSTTPVVTERSNRVLNPGVMTVSAGDQPFEQTNETRLTSSVGCVISAPRTDNTNLVWEKELPAGYVLCKQNDATKQCVLVSPKIGCYLN